MNKINDTLKKLTPNSKDALKDKVFNHREVKPIILEVTADSYQHQIVDNISQFMKRQKGSRDPRTLQLTRHVINMTTNFDDEKLPSERYLTKLLGVSRHQLNVVRKLQSDYGKSEAAKLILNLRRSATRKVDENIVKRAVDFWFSNLRESPCMSDFSTLRIGSKVIEKHKTFLQTEPDEELYDKFIKENPDCKSKISLSYFKNKKRCKLYFAKRLKNRSVCLNPKQVKVRQLWRALQINKVKWMNTFKKSMAATYLAICDKLFKRVNLNFKRDRFANQALLRIGDHIVEYLLPRRCLCPVTSKYCFFNWPKRTSEFLDMIMCPRR